MICFQVLIDIVVVKYNGRNDIHPYLGWKDSRFVWLFTYSVKYVLSVTYFDYALKCHFLKQTILIITKEKIN